MTNTYLVQQARRPTPYSRGDARAIVLKDEVAVLYICEEKVLHATMQVKVGTIYVEISLRA
jgi:hypothetical protein